MLDLHRLVKNLLIVKMKEGGMKVKTLKKLLKKAGLKTSGKKTALTRRAKKARLLKGSGLFDIFRKPKQDPTDPTAFSASNPMFKPANTTVLPKQPANTTVLPKQPKWEGSPEQIAARAEWLESPGTVDMFFEQFKRDPEHFDQDESPIEKYREIYGSDLFDQKDDLIKDYLHHFYMHVAGREDDLITIWEGSPSQIAARAERMKDRMKFQKAHVIFVRLKFHPEKYSDYYPGLIDSYLKKHGSKLFDQDDDLAKDYIAHQWLSEVAPGR